MQLYHISDSTMLSFSSAKKRSHFEESQTRRSRRQEGFNEPSQPNFLGILPPSLRSRCPNISVPSTLTLSNLDSMAISTTDLPVLL